jgi:hypothetical protein
VQREEVRQAELSQVAFRMCLVVRGMEWNGAMAVSNIDIPALIYVSLLLILLNNKKLEHLCFCMTFVFAFHSHRQSYVLSSASADFSYG